MKAREALITLMGEPDPNHSDPKELGQFIAGTVGAPLAWKYGVEEAVSFEHAVYGFALTGISLGVAIKSARRIIRDKTNWRKRTSQSMISRPDESEGIVSL